MIVGNYCNRMSNFVESSNDDCKTPSYRRNSMANILENPLPQNAPGFFFLLIFSYETGVIERIVIRLFSGSRSSP